MLVAGRAVRKFHEVTCNAGRTISVLLSLTGGANLRMDRDANRRSDQPTIPDSWRLAECTTPKRLAIQLLGDDVVVIWADNSDPFRGPVPALAALLSG